MRGIALHYCLAGVHPRQRPPGSRVGARDDGAVAPVCHRAPSALSRLFFSCHSLARQLGGGSATCASTVALTLHQLSRLRAGILGSLMRGIALRYCLAGVHPRLRLPGSRVGARDDGAVAPVCHRAPSALPPILSSPVIPASERESWVALCVVLRCAIASPVSIPANASQDPASSAG